jgi:hypothetical protein
MSKIRIANPQPGCARYTSEAQAERYVRRKEAVLIGRNLHFLCATEQRHQRNIEIQIETASTRERSDAYVDPRGVIYWNGARSLYIGGKDLAMFPPCCNVVFPKIGTKRAAERFAQ